jgi:hypothetical protein
MRAPVSRLRTIRPVRRANITFPRQLRRSDRNACKSLERIHIGASGRCRIDVASSPRSRRSMCTGSIDLPIAEPPGLFGW